MQHLPQRWHNSESSSFVRNCFAIESPKKIRPQVLLIISDNKNHCGLRYSAGKKVAQAFSLCRFLNMLDGNKLEGFVTSTG